MMTFRFNYSCFFLLAVLLFPVKVLSQEVKAMPDSMLTVDKAFAIRYENRALAEQMLAEIRSRKLDTEYDIDHCLASIYYNYMEFREALVIYERMLKSKAVRNDVQKKMEVLQDMCDTYDVLCENVKLRDTIDQLYKLAIAENDKYYQGQALFLLGVSLFNSGDSKGGIAQVEEAVKLMGESDRSGIIHETYGMLNVLSSQYNRIGDTEKALEVLDRNERLIRSEDPVNTGDLMVLLAKKASMLVLLHRVEEADSVYAVWESLPKTNNLRRQYYIVDYYRHRGRFRDALHIYESQLKCLREKGDTVSLIAYNMYWGMAETCYGLKQYQRSADLYQRVVEMGDSLKRIEADANAKELATIYETHEKERQINRQAYWMTLLFFIIALLIVGIILQLRYMRTLKERSKVMANTVDELIIYRKAALQGHDSQKPRNGSEEGVGDNNSATSDDDLQKYFISVNSVVVNGLLFRQPDFDREQLIRATGIEKNRLSTIISRCAGTNIPGYINKLRVEYATHMMKEHPDYTLQAIAEACGFVTQSTFIRAFKMVFGLTPSEYRQSHILPPPIAEE